MRGRAAGTPRDLGAGVGAQLDAEDAGRARQHPLQLGRLVEVHVRGEAEPVTQRAGQRAGPGGGADQRERCDLERNRRGARAFADDDVDAEVLHRQVQHLLGGPRDAVDLVDEQHVVLDEVGQHRGQVAGAFQRRAGRDPQRRAEFGGDDHRQRRLAQPRRAGQQDVIRCAAAVLGALDDQLQLLAHPRLADELAQRSRPQAGVDIAFADGQRRRDLAILGVLDRPRRSGSSLLTQHRQRRAQRAGRGGLRVVRRAPCRWPPRPA